MNTPISTIALILSLIFAIISALIRQHTGINFWVIAIPNAFLVILLLYLINKLIESNKE